MARAEGERRIDLAMRQYVAEILRYLAQGGDHANARMNMTERGVPAEVQQRVIDGDAAPE
ncbi:MAG TPA: hypothetical protein PL143_15175 [Rhodocyclaceae bacterium]|nr:hypothetical protein [Rhodocyclaceae bacterium]